MVPIDSQMRATEEKLKKKFSRISLICFLISIILILWIVVVFTGVYILNNGYNWAGLSFDIWVYMVCGIIVFFIILNFILYNKFSSINKVRVEAEKPKPEFIDGKRVYVYSHPERMEGGIFSKTYIAIDKHSVLRLRSLMVPPNHLWNKDEIKEEIEDKKVKEKKLQKT